jgi:hypothetical protein
MQQIYPYGRFVLPMTGIIVAMERRGERRDSENNQPQT